MSIRVNQSGLMLLITPDALPEGDPRVPLSDSRYKVVAEKWSACMKNYGFDYETPLYASRDHEWVEAAMAAVQETAGGVPLTPTSGVSAYQTAVAAADVQCKLDTNLVGIAVAVQSAYDQIYIDAHREQLADLQREIAEFLKGNIQVPPITNKPQDATSSPEPSTFPYATSSP
ncbi:MAG: hypothetical protein LBC29_05020 [Propionibacteriaceae bacterium]|jgi:hypothetical protein|nr:hypothetical protein [Propionibacteriaceae bacterium]